MNVFDGTLLLPFVVSRNVFFPRTETVLEKNRDGRERLTDTCVYVRASTSVSINEYNTPVYLYIRARVCAYMFMARVRTGCPHNVR